MLREEAKFGDATFELGYSSNRTLERRTMIDAMRRNLEGIVQRARDGGTDLVLMTYPSQKRSGFYTVANHEIRRAARRTATPLVNLRREFASRCPDAACREFLFDDGHPKAAGYAIVAELVAEKLQQMLAESRERH
jgi:lysophospholipase L1-like esterase